MLVARALERRLPPTVDRSAHYQIRLDDRAGRQYRAAVNVLSQLPPSELLYAVIEDFEHPVTERLAGLLGGWHPIGPGPDGGGLDLVRGGLLDRASMRSLPPLADGPNNDLADLLDDHVLRAIAQVDARLYVFGERWTAAAPDPVFRFKPGAGVHGVHMNQGNTGRFVDDDGVWQDGGLLVRYSDGSWTAVFLAFQSQSWRTDDATGHALVGQTQA